MMLTQLTRRAVSNKVDERAQYLTFTVTTGSSVFGWAERATSGHLEYSLNGGQTWVTIADGESTPAISAGQSVMWRGDLRPTYSTSNVANTAGIGTFSATGYFEASGNTMSLLFYDNFKSQVSLSGNAFRCVFCALYNGNAYITRAALLPATTIAIHCYSYMYYGCTSLVNAPELPATTIAIYCYSYMFYGCASLTQAPELPATTLASYCYRSMFYGCASLTQAPELPATTLASYCYYTMFYDCRSLSYIKCLATDISAAAALNNWVYRVSSTGTFVKAAGMEDWTRGANGIPTNWTVIDDTDE